MAHLNRKADPHRKAVTKESVLNNAPFEQLSRAVMTCLLWEGTEDERISKLVPSVPLEDVAYLARTAHEDMKLRHVPLLLAREMARHPGRVENPSVIANTIEAVINRPDSLTEFLAIYWKDGRQPLSGQVKKGLARAFAKFSEYQLAKYNRDHEVKLRDVLFLSHAKPKDVEPGSALWNKDARTNYKPNKGFVREFTKGELLYGRVVHDQLVSPETWENKLSRGEDKKETFADLMKSGKLGGLAFLRNLRNIKEAGISKDVVNSYADVAKVDGILPFQFMSAQRAVPEWEDAIEKMMLRAVENIPKLPGRTVLVVDLSGSMRAQMADKSGLERTDVAAAFSVLCRELCENIAVFATAGNDHSRKHATITVPPRRGFALAEKLRVGGDQEIYRRIGQGGIFLKQVTEFVSGTLGDQDVERCIVITDEQDTDIDGTSAKAKLIGKHNYIVNIATNARGIGYGRFTHINGWSEAVLKFIAAYEANEETMHKGAA